MSDESREFGTLWWVQAIVGVTGADCLLGSVSLFRIGPTLTALGIAALAVFCSAVAFVEGLVSWVVLRRDSLEIVSNFRRVVIPGSDLVSAVAAKGVPIALERASGRWIRLPETLDGPHLDTLRAWLKRTAPADPESAALESLP